MSEFWTSGIVHNSSTHNKHECSVLNPIWPKSELVRVMENCSSIQSRSLLR